MKTCELCQNKEPGRSQPAMERFICSVCIVRVGGMENEERADLVAGLREKGRGLTADFVGRLV